MSRRSDSVTSPSHRAVLVSAVAIISSMLCFGVLVLAASAQESVVHEFDRQQLTGTYYSEGAGFGDLNKDGHQDVVYGPYWFAGPTFQDKHEIYPAVVQPTERYSDHFFCWTYDFDGDDWLDVFVVGFPGTPAYVYQNPGSQDQNRHWPKHEVFDWVSNESPQWTNMIGDERPELVCSRDGYLGYVTPDWGEPFGAWSFHRISGQVAAKRFGHGLGVGDVNGDGRKDVLVSNGWFQQPASTGGPWQFHPVEFSKDGGADMFAYDVDGDGDNDVITSLSAHAFGLAWYEQYRTGGERAFRRHLIMGSKASDNPYGVLFSELHSVNLADVDGDGLKDICTGKTYYSHHKQAPMWDSGAVVYWFKLSRTEQGVQWIPYRADGESGIGRQLVVGDVNGDGLPDFVTGGMKGCHVLLQSKKVVDRISWLDAQPRIHRDMQAGLLPKEAAAQMTAPPGFHVQLAAGEPTVHQPIAFTFDHRGRVWLAEAYNYPIRAPEGQGKDKIIILEDTDQDGTLDTRREFATGLNLVSGLEVGFGGVWVGAAPYLMFIPDEDGDDVPDGEPQILLDGFGYQDTHETLNAFIWGPDGWLYGCHGVFTHSRVGKPGTPPENRIPLNAAVWRYHPTRHEFDVFARGTSNPWGVDFNDHGQAFITACVIPHLWHIIQGARYQRQGGQHFNPYLYDDIKTIADHSHYTGNIRDSAWWGHEPELSDSVSLAGGGHAHCGAMIYLADNWPAPYRNSIYFNNIHGNRVNNDILERQGSGYVGHHGRDFLMANDKWYRGINLKYGPDGSVYLIDWYDKNACHRRNPEIWDRSNGRVYRVRFGDVRPKSVDLSRLSSLELAELQMHDNDWYVRTARRLLQERAAQGQSMDAVYRRLEHQLADAETSPKQLRAMWALHVTGGLRRGMLRTIVETGDEYLRAWAIQLAVPEVLPGAEPPVIPPVAHEKLQELAHDSSALVRLYVASALQRIAIDQRWEVAARLLAHAEDAEDHNLPLMIWYGIEPAIPTDVQRALRLARDSTIPLVSRFIVRRAAEHENSFGQVVEALAAATPSQKHLILDEILAAFEGRVEIPIPASWTAAYLELMKNDDAAIREKADQVAVVLGDKRILPRMRQILVDADQSIARRERALQVLVRGRDAEAAESFIAVLDTPSLRGPAIRALAAYNHDSVAPELLGRYSALDAGEQRDAISTLTSRPKYAMALLAAIERNQLPRTDVHAYHVRQLQSFEDPRLVERLNRVWGSIRETSADKKRQIEYYKRMLQEDRSNPDLAHGRALFKKNCATCHKLFGDGDTIGPDITGSNRANLDYILENIVDPSSVVSNDYKMSTLVLADGRVITGLVERETDSALTVRTVNDSLLIPKSDIEVRRPSELSLMPEGQLETFSTQEIRDLIAYLASPRQVDLPRVEAQIDSVTGQVEGAIEGETLKVVGEPQGDVRPQVMSAFKADDWSDNRQLYWTGQNVGAMLDLSFSIQKAGMYDLELVLTRARDYGVVELFIDGKSLGSPIDCFVPNRVDTTGVLAFKSIELSQGRHQLTAKIVGKHPRSVNTMFGLDYLRFTPVGAASAAAVSH